MLEPIRNLIGSFRPLNPDLENIQDSTREGTFVTWEALVTFPVSSAAIAIIWRVLQRVFPDSAFIKTLTLPFILSLVFGITFFIIDITDPAGQKDRTTRKIIQKFIVAMINSFFLAAAVLGIDTTIS